MNRRTNADQVERASREARHQPGGAALTRRAFGAGVAGVASLGLTLGRPAGTAAQTPDPRTRVLAAILRDTARDYDIPGAAVGVLHQRAEIRASYGTTRQGASGEPVDTTTLFGLASITKTFTGLTAMRQVDQGTLDLDVPIRRYLPGLKLADESVAARVTLRQIFTHTSGLDRDIPDGWPNFGTGDDARAAMIARFDQLKQIHKLGEVHEYSNMAIDLAARVVEVVAGTSYEVAVRDLVLKPLGMDRSTFFEAEARGSRVSWGHEGGGQRAIRPFFCPRAENADGGLASSVDDLLRYARFWLGDGTAEDGTRLLSAAHLAEMFTPRVKIPESDSSIGVVWEIENRDGVRLISHDGLYAGFAGVLIVAPDERFAVAVVTNDEDNGGDCWSDVADQVLEEYLDI